MPPLDPPVIDYSKAEHARSRAVEQCLDDAGPPLSVAYAVPYSQMTQAPCPGEGNNRRNLHVRTVSRGSKMSTPDGVILLR
jgi:hypothetical protein